jgi:PAS domain S-box-containing protein
LRMPSKKPRSQPLGRYLAALVGIVVLPVLFTALILGAVFITRERDKLTDTAVSAAQEMTARFDNELNAQIAVLQVLAASPNLDNRDFELFQRQVEVIGKQPGTQIVLRDSSGQELVNSSYAFGNSLANTQYPTDAQAAVKPVPVIYSFPESQNGRTWALGITLSIFKAGKLAYFIDLNADAAVIQKFFHAGKLPKSWAWQALDGNFHPIAHSVNTENLVLPVAYLQKYAGNSFGSFIANRQNAADVMIAYAKSPLTGWSVSILVPKQDLEDPLWKMLYALGLLVSTVATAAIIAVVIVNSRLRKSAQHLVQVSRELGNKEIVDPALTGVKEFDQVSEAISAASISLREKNMLVRDSESRIRTLLDNLFVYVGLLDLQGRMIEANATPMTMAGLTRDDVIGRFIWDTYWWSWSPQVKEQMENAVTAAREGRASRFEVDMRMSGGALHTIDFQLAPLHDRDGHIAYLLPSAVDITEKKALEGKLQESLAQIEATYAATPVALFMMDTNLRFIAVNPQFAAMTKISIDEHLGKSLREVIGEDGKQLETQLRKVLKTGKPISKFEYTMTPDEGERITRVYRASYYPVLNHEGKLQGIAGAVQDLTGMRSAH